MKKTERKKECVLILHNVRSIHNVGAIFRTADAAGVSKIHLTGYTGTPLGRFGKERKDFAKTSLGSEKTVKWEKHTQLSPLIRTLKKEGFYIIAVEQSPRAKDYKNIKIPAKAAVIFGNETKGLSSQALSLADVIAEIPMRGKKESLNVSVAAGIVLYGILEL